MSEENERQEGGSGGDGGEGGGRRRRRRRRGGRSGGSGGDNNNANRSNNSNRGGKRGGGGGGQKRGGGNRGGGGGGGNRGGGNRRSSGRGNRSTPREKFGGRDPVNTETERQTGPLELNAFNLFCAYHLGITANNGYKKPATREVARRFDRSVNELQDALRDCGMDNQTLKEVGYNVSYAQLDVRVAPEGIDKIEIAKGLFDEFKAENDKFVDWSESAFEEDDEDYDDFEDAALSESE